MAADMELSELEDLVRGVQYRLVPPHWKDEALGAGMLAAWQAWEECPDRPYVAKAIRLRTIDFMREWQRGSRRREGRRAFDLPLTIKMEDGEEVQAPWVPPVTDAAAIEEIDLRDQLDRAVSAPMAFLTQGEMDVYRLHVLEEMPLRRCGEILGVTESRCSQLFKSLGRKLRSYLDE